MDEELCGDFCDQDTAVKEAVVNVLQFPASTGEAQRSLRTAGLSSVPLSGGVENLALRCELPSPAVAVRNLVEQAQFAHLCTIMSAMHHRRAGYPFGTLVDLAVDGAGYPIFSLSPLAIPTRNIMEDPRCSLVMQMPGWTGLANARVTIFGDVYILPKELREQAEQIFALKHGDPGSSDRWVSGNAIYFRMNRILDIYFVGGFGTVQWVDVEEYTAAQPDQIAVLNPIHTLQVLNELYSEPLRALLSGGAAPAPADDAAFISIDKLGADVRVRRGGDYSVHRVGFEQEVECLDGAIAALQNVFACADASS